MKTFPEHRTRGTAVGAAARPAASSVHGGRTQTPEQAIGPLIIAALVLYAIIEFVRPQTLLNINASWFRPALLLNAIFCLYWFRKWGAKAIVADRIQVCVLLLVVMSALWTPFAVNNFSAMQTTIAHGINLCAIVTPLGLILAARDRRRQYFVWWIAIVMFLAVFVLLNGGRGPGGIVQDENDMAFALCMGLPYPYLLAQRSGISMLKRLAFYGMALFIVMAIIWTHSRGGFVGLACVTLYLIYLSQNRIRNLLICGMLGVLALQFAPSSYVSRVSTITDMEDSSINERLLSWHIASLMFLDNPIFGVGPRNYPWHTTTYQQQIEGGYEAGRGLAGRASHSVYFTVLPEYGLVGTSIFAIMLITMMRRLTDCEQRLKPHVARGDADAEADLLLARAHKAATIGFLSAGAFISVFYYPQIWYTAGFTIALSRDVLQRYSATPITGSADPELEALE